MSEFSGFPDGKMRLTPLPQPFFDELLPLIDDLTELKVTLCAFHLLDQMEGNLRYFTASELAGVRGLRGALGDEPLTALHEALERAVARGTLLSARPVPNGPAIYLLNSERGRAALRALQAGAWQPDADRLPPAVPDERPNIFRLYEENIGPLTPMMADVLRDAEKQYPPEWIEDALRVALENNVRKWVYVEKILRSWQERGRDAQDRRNDKEGYRRYLEGEYGDFGEH